MRIVSLDLRIGVDKAARHAILGLEKTRHESVSNPLSMVRIRRKCADSSPFRFSDFQRLPDPSVIFRCPSQLDFFLRAKPPSSFLAAIS
jgi:hypothetical protein